MPSLARASRRRRPINPLAFASVVPRRGLISGIDLFCGVGGLSEGLQQAGISIVAGVDVDRQCRYAFETNIEAPFLEQDVASVTADRISSLWPAGSTRLLAGCAPCQPFSPYRRGADTSKESSWPLLGEFGRIVVETRPELVTMENVPRIAKSGVFRTFVETLEAEGYFVDWLSCHGPRYGLAQERRRLVLLASRIAPISVPTGHLHPAGFQTVRDAIGNLPPIASGEVHESDRLHRSRSLSDLNLRRIRASRPGGNWSDWEPGLRAKCHTRSSGSSFKNVYARMSWDAPSPTITTLAHNFGAGRFGHPEQDRPISLREAAILQGFPSTYEFVHPADQVTMAGVGKMIGNAVPPPIARAIGETLIEHVRAHRADESGD